MHRTTAELCEFANAPRSLPSWLDRKRTIHLMAAIAGFLIAANCAISDAADPKPAAPKDTKATTAGAKSAESDSQEAGDQAQSVFSMSDPKTTDEEWKKWSEGTGRADYNNRIRNGDLDGTSMQVISNGIKMQIYAMTLPTQRDNLGILVSGLLRSVHGAADSKDAATQRQVRQAMMKEIIHWCHEIGGNQFYVRLNAAILLGNLFIVPETPANRGAAEFFADAFEPLLEVLERPGQPEGVKLAAVNGLRNAANSSVPPLSHTALIRLATKLLVELEKTDTCEWYQSAFAKLSVHSTKPWIWTVGHLSCTLSRRHFSTATVPSVRERPRQKHWGELRSPRQLISTSWPMGLPISAAKSWKPGTSESGTYAAGVLQIFSWRSGQKTPLKGRNAPDCWNALMSQASRNTEIRSKRSMHWCGQWWCRSLKRPIPPSPPKSVNIWPIGSRTIHRRKCASLPVCR